MNPQTNQFPWQLVTIAAGACLGLTVAAYALGVQPLIERQRRDDALRERLQEQRQTASDKASSLADKSAADLF